MLNDSVINAGKKSKLLFWVIMFEAVFVFLFFPREWAKATIIKEQDILYRHIGETAASDVEGLGIGWYDTVIVNSHLQEQIYKLFLPTKKQIKTSTGLERLGQRSIFPFLESRLQVFFAVLEQMFIRLAVLWSWAPFLALLVIPSTVDGYFSRAKKKFSFAYSSPLLRNASVVGINVLIYGPLLFFFVPIPITPYIYPFFMCVAAVLMAIAIANSQKSL